MLFYTYSVQQIAELLLTKWQSNILPYSIQESNVNRAIKSETHEKFPNKPDL